VACALRKPFEHTPYLFLFGPENSGKSTLYESLRLLLTKGVVEADRALTNSNDFNGELAGAIICAIEEKDITKHPGAHAKIKKWVTGRTISIRKMRHDSYEQPNTTHWIQTANSRDACPVFPGDSRITMIYVPDLLPGQEIGQEKLMARLEEEAPHFLHTLMHLELPPVICRHSLPVLKTASKQRTEEDNRSPLEIFIDECCETRADAKLLTFKEFYARFCEWLPANEKHHWTKQRAQRELPVRHPLVTGHAGTRFVSGLVLRPVTAEGDAK